MHSITNTHTRKRLHETALVKTWSTFVFRLPIYHHRGKTSRCDSANLYTELVLHEGWFSSGTSLVLISSQRMLQIWTAGDFSRSAGQEESMQLIK